MGFFDGLIVLAKSLGVTLDTISDEDLKKLNERLKGTSSAQEVSNTTTNFIIEHGRDPRSIEAKSKQASQMVNSSVRLNESLAKRVTPATFNAPELSNQAREAIDREVVVKPFNPRERSG